MPEISSTTRELFHIWLSSCLEEEEEDQHHHQQHALDNDPDSSIASASTLPLNNTSPLYNNNHDQELFSSSPPPPRHYQTASTNTTTTTPCTTNEQQLRKEATAFFRSLVRETTIIVHGQRLSTKASHEQALAVLVQELQPAFVATSTSTTTMKPKVRAVACLTGALEGCRKEKAILSVDLIRLLANFWMNLIGPILHQSDNHNDDTDDDETALRDAAMKGLCVLMECLVGKESNTNNSNGYFEEENSGTSPSTPTTISWLKLAQTAVQRRCAVDNDNENNNSNYQPDNALAMLPRSKRSLCFQTLKTAVERNNTNNHQEMVDFVIFIANCLHGESDPRCLLQLLELIYLALDTFRPVFLQNKQQNQHQAMMTAVFDAVAPYYPIQFTPPPNNVHGITKTSLQTALMRVLSSFWEYDATTNNNDNTSSHNKGESMMNLSLNVVLERIIPPPEDDPPSLDDWKEGLQDLSTLLFTTTEKTCNLCHVSTTKARAIVSALLHVHREASLQAIRRSRHEQHGNNNSSAKTVADLCRTVVARLARETERNAPSLWNIMVGDVVQELWSNNINQHRIAIAYTACLCSSGGQRTMNHALDIGLNRLLQIYESNSTPAKEMDLAAIVYGVGAFFASAVAALDQAKKDGIDWHPHPLQQYSAKALNMCCTLIIEHETSNSPSNLPAPFVAAIKTLETVYVATPSEHIRPLQIEQQLMPALKILLSSVVPSDSADAMGIGENDSSEEWKKACAQSLGLLLGKVLSVEAQDEYCALPTQSILFSDPVKEFVRSTVLSELVAFAGNLDNADHHERAALSVASVSSLQASHSLVLQITQSLIAAFEKNAFDAAVSFAQCLGCLFTENKSFAPRAFQLLEAPGPTALEVRSDLASSVARKHEIRKMSSGNQVADINIDIELALSIAAQIQLAYSGLILPEQMASIITTSCDAMPPLTVTDLVKSSIELCFLSAALGNENVQLPANSEKLLENLQTQLLDFAITPSYPSASRAFAIESLHALAMRFATESDIGRILSRVADKVVDMAHGSVMKETTASDFNVDILGDCLMIMGVIGCTAARRGKSCASTADQIVNFLVDLACSRGAQCTFSQHMETGVDLGSLPSPFSVDDVDRLSTQAARALGCMLSTQAGHFLWKQRLSHVASRRIRMSWKDADELSNGMVAASCQVICGSNMKCMPAEELKAFARMIVRSLSPDTGKRPFEVTKLQLVSILKALAVSPSALTDLAFSIITGAMRSYALADQYSPGESLTCKLLSLQVLETSTHIVGALPAIKETKALVVSILGAAMNHPSSILRQAAVHVRNRWFLLE